MWQLIYAFACLHMGRFLLVDDEHHLLLAATTDKCVYVYTLDTAAGPSLLARYVYTSARFYSCSLQDACLQLDAHPTL